MNKEDKELVLKDLCARLPYGVKCKFEDTIRITDGESSPFYNYILSARHLDLFINNKNFYIKPYLRPMSSMTDEESNELESITFPLMEKDWDGNENPACIRWIDIPKYMDFILSHHFDYQGLIEKGLAIPVTKENNQYK